MKRKYFLLLGGPGSGKGTQAKLASEKIGISHISTGDKFRKLWKCPNLTPLEQKIKVDFDKGGYVPDDMTNELVKQWLEVPEYSKGAFLDGYPRTLPQAKLFDDEMLSELNGELPAVFFFKVGRDALYIRMTKRVTCEKCGTAFNTVTNPPKKDSICDVCGGNLVGRKDQEEDAVMRRFDVYMEKTEPLFDYYKEKNILHEINGEQSIEDVHKDFMDKLTPFTQ